MRTEANPPAVDCDLAGQGMTGTPQWPPLIIWCCANNPKVQPVAAGHSMALTRWQLLLDELLGRIAGQFTRVEPRRRARAFVLGLLADLPARPVVDR
jgi:hypothetical protein